MRGASAELLRAPDQEAPLAGEQREIGRRFADLDLLTWPASVRDRR